MINFYENDEKGKDVVQSNRVTTDKNNNKLENWGKAQRESARRPKSDWKEIRGGGKISSAPKSRGPNSNALAYAERAMSTKGRST